MPGLSPRHQPVAPPRRCRPPPCISLAVCPSQGDHTRKTREPKAQGLVPCGRYILLASPFDPGRSGSGWRHQGVHRRLGSPPNDPPDILFAASMPQHLKRAATLRLLMLWYRPSPRRFCASRPWVRERARGLARDNGAKRRHHRRRARADKRRPRPYPKHTLPRACAADRHVAVADPRRTPSAPMRSRK